MQLFHHSDVLVLSSDIKPNFQVMLLGHSDEYTADRIMKVTVVFNHFGRELVQRMPRYIIKINDDYYTKLSNI